MNTEAELKELSTEDTALQAELNSIITKNLDGSKKFFSDRENNRIRFEGLDNGSKTKKEKWQTRYISPFPATSIEQKAAYLTEAMTSLGPDFIQFLPYDNVEQEDQSLILTRLVSYYLSKTNTVEKVYLFSKDLLIYGTAIAQVFYNYRKRKIVKKTGPKLSMVNGQYQQVDGREETEKVDKDQPDFKNVRLNNFYPDNECTSLEDARNVVCRELISFSRISSYKESRNLRNLEQAKAAGIPKRAFNKTQTASNSTRLGRAGRMAEYDVDSIINMNADESKNDPICELMTIYRPGTCQLVLNGVVISDEDSYYEDIRYPFIISRNQPLNGEFWGRSDMDIMENNVKHHEELANLIKDNYVEHLRPTRLLDMSLGQEAIKRLQNAGPGAQIAVPDTNGVVELRPTQFDTTVVQYAQGFLDEAKSAVAINPLMEGQNPGSGIRSQGSLELYQQIGSTRMSVLVNMMAYEFGRLGEMFVQLIKQFGNEEIGFMISGKLGESYQQTISPINIPDNVQCKVQLSTIADSKRQQRVASMLQLIQTAVQLDRTGTFRDQRAMVEVFIESRLFEDSKEFYETDPQVILSRALLAANAAGNKQPLVTGGLTPGPSAQQQAAPPQGEPQQQDLSGQQPQAPTQPTEGNLAGSNQYAA